MQPLAANLPSIYRGPLGSNAHPLRPHTTLAIASLAIGLLKVNNDSPQLAIGVLDSLPVFLRISGATKPSLLVTEIW